MSTINRVEVLGRLGTTPELEHLGKTEISHCLLRIAVERWAEDAQDASAKTIWLSVHCWRDQAEACAQYLKAGQRIYMEGHLSVTTWEQEGQPRSRLEVVADRVIFLDKPASPAPPPETA